MRVIKVLLVSAILCALMIPVSAMAKEYGTLKEVIDAYDSSRCKQCHEQIYKDWEKAAHSMPIMGPFNKTLGTLQDYLKQRNPEKGEFKKSNEVTKSMKEYMMPCFVCHVPQLREMSEKAAQELADAVLKENYDVLEKLQINCIVCHNQISILRKFRDGNPEPDTVYGNKDLGGAHADKVFTKSKRHEMMEDSSFCGQCHQGPNVVTSLVLPSSEPMWCVSNYDSWLQNYIPNGGDKNCQDCHMRAPNTGHRFPPNYQDYKYEMERLKKHIKFDATAMAYTQQIKVPELISIPMVVIKTKTWTEEIGHRFTDGCPSPSHFLLKVTVKGKDGKELFNETKYYFPQKKRADAENKVIFASLRKLTLLRDTTLQPFKANEETFEVKLPKDVEDATVEATLTLVIEPGVKEAVYELGKFSKFVSIKGRKQ
ncbi:MAG: multiheme c-type cytochrome ExtKL [Nitrospirota bacterium]